MYEDCGYDFTATLGLCIYTPLTLFAIIRLVLILHQEKTFFGSHKSVFHLFVFMYYLLEGGSLVELYYNSVRDGETTYVLHSLAIYCNLVAYAVVIHFWALKMPFDYEIHRHVLVGEVVVLLVNLILIILDFLTYFSRTFKDESVNTNIYVASLIVDSISLVLLSSIMLVLGLRLYFRLRNHANYNPTTFKGSASLLVRIIAILFTCTVLYTTRGAFEILQARMYVEQDDIVFKHCHTMWYLVTKWIPYIIPSLILLNLMKPRHLPIARVLHQRLWVPMRDMLVTCCYGVETKKSMTKSGSNTALKNLNVLDESINEDSQKRMYVATGSTFDPKAHVQRNIDTSFELANYSSNNSFCDSNFESNLSHSINSSNSGIHGVHGANGVSGVSGVIARPNNAIVNQNNESLNPIVVNVENFRDTNVGYDVEYFNDSM